MLVTIGTLRVKSFQLYTEGHSFSVKIAEDWIPSRGWFRLYECPPTGAVCWQRLTINLEQTAY